MSAQKRDFSRFSKIFSKKQKFFPKPCNQIEILLCILV